MSILDRIKKWLGMDLDQNTQATNLEVSRELSTDSENIDGFLTMLANSREQEIDCGDVYHLLAEYAEAVENGEDVTRLMPLVKQHLEICHDCEEELEAVLEILHSIQ